MDIKFMNILKHLQQELMGVRFIFIIILISPHRLHLEQDFSYVIGEDNNNNPLPLIPQTRLNSNLKYEFAETDKKFQLKTLLLQRTQFLDKNDVSTFETPSNSYEIYNIEGNFSYTGKQKC